MSKEQNEIKRLQKSIVHARKVLSGAIENENWMAVKAVVIALGFTLKEGEKDGHENNPGTN